MAKNVKVTICRGGDCRKRCDVGDLARQLAVVADVETSKCMGLCKGPVVVVDQPGMKATVIAEVRTSKQRNDVEALVRGDGELSNRLAKRVVKGSKRKKALRRAGLS